MINIAFLGNWGTAKEILKVLIERNGVKVKFVVSQYNYIKGKRDKWYNMVSNFAKKHETPIYNQEQFKKNDKKLLNLIKKENVDLIVSCAYPFLLKKEITDVMNKKMGIVNFHGSLLPKYRGLSPVVWAIINDDDYLGMTLHYIDEGCDSGDIIFQSRINNNKEDDINIIAEKLKIEGVKLCKNFLNCLEKNNISRKKQDHSKASKAPKLKNDDLNIDLKQPASKIKAFFRGTSFLNPYICIGGKKYIVKKIKITNNKSLFRDPKIIRIFKKYKIIKISTFSYDILLKIDISKKDLKNINIGDIING